MCVHLIFFAQIVQCSILVQDQFDSIKLISWHVLWLTALVERMPVLNFLKSWWYRKPHIRETHFDTTPVCSPSSENLCHSYSIALPYLLCFGLFVFLQCRVSTVNPVVPPSHRDGDWVKQRLFLFWLHNGRHVSFLLYFIRCFSSKNKAWSDGRPNRIEKARFVGNQSLLGRFQFSTAIKLCN